MAVLAAGVVMGAILANSGIASAADDAGSDATPTPNAGASQTPGAPQGTAATTKDGKDCPEGGRGGGHGFGRGGQTEGGQQQGGGRQGGHLRRGSGGFGQGQQPGGAPVAPPGGDSAAQTPSQSPASYLTF